MATNTTIKKEFSRATSPSDTRLNMAIFMQDQHHHDLSDIREIIHLVHGHRNQPLRRLRNWMGLRLNMREIIRSLTVGTRRTIRTRDQSTQTDSSDSISRQETEEVHSIFSQETHFSSDDRPFDSINSPDLFSEET